MTDPEKREVLWKDNTSFDLHVFCDRDGNMRVSVSKGARSNTVAIYLEPDDIRRLYRLKILAHLTDQGILRNVKPP